MAVTPLTPAQRQAVDALVAAARLEQVPVDLQRCGSFLRQAAAALGDLPNVQHPQNVYNLAYDAARHFDQMRRDRNRQRYDARPTTTAAATAAAATAGELRRAGTARV